MYERIPVYQPSLSGNEKKYLNECIDSSWISSRGEFLDRFERGFCEITGAQFAVTASNGTTALHVAMMALDLGPGDEVIVPTLTYVASVNAARYVGAVPVFCDSEPDWWQADPARIEAAITPRTKAIVAVHLYGHPAPMEEICAIAERHGLHVIEDCAEALGARIGLRPVGSFGHIATYSFFGNKTITTGEGGMVTTDDRRLADRVRKLKSQALSGDREYWHDEIGHNFRMTNLTAAIGCAQLERCDVFLAQKRRLADLYRDTLRATPLQFLGEQPGCTNSFWMVAAIARSAAEVAGLRAWLGERNIETRPLFPPVHLMPMYGGRAGEHPVAERLSSLGLNFPSWPTLPDAAFERIVEAVAGFYATVPAEVALP